MLASDLAIFPDFHNLLESAQVIVELLPGFLAEQFRYHGAGDPGRSVVIHVDSQDRAASTGCAFKSNSP